MAHTQDEDEDSFENNVDISEVPGANGQIEYLIDLFAVQEELWLIKHPQYYKMKNRRFVVYTKMATEMNKHFNTNFWL